RGEIPPVGAELHTVHRGLANEYLLGTVEVADALPPFGGAGNLPEVNPLRFLSESAKGDREASAVGADCHIFDFITWNAHRNLRDGPTIPHVSDIEIPFVRYQEVSAVRTEPQIIDLFGRNLQAPDLQAASRLPHRDGGLLSVGSHRGGEQPTVGAE